MQWGSKWHRSKFCKTFRQLDSELYHFFIHSKSIFLNLIKMPTWFWYPPTEKLIDSNPCYSAVSLLTLLALKGLEIPRASVGQENLLQNISSTQLISFSEVLKNEMMVRKNIKFRWNNFYIQEIQQRCATTNLGKCRQN